MDIDGLTCLVTGGSAGLGLATAKALHSRGANVTVFDLKLLPEGLLGKSLHFRMTDVTDDSDVKRAIEQILAQFGALHVCVNCAGIVRGAPLVGPESSFPADLFRRTLDVNLTGTFITMAHAAAAMARNAGSGPDQERGVIINTASIAAYDASSSAAYAASKGGVVSMNLTAARQLANLGIRVNAIAPGFMDTEMFASLPPAHVQSLLSTTVYPRRLGLPDEFARLVCHIIENRYINASTIRIDAGARS